MTAHTQQSSLPDVIVYCEADQSSFEEVSGTCSNKDDPEMKCLTVRAMIIGLAFGIGMSVIGMWVFAATPFPLIPPILVILTSHLIDKLRSWIPWQKIGGDRWTIKEHTIVLIIANIAWSIWTTLNFSLKGAVQWQERQPGFKFIYMFFLIVAIQFLGFGLAGILRRFLVWPSGQVWPGNFPSIALLRTLHEDRKIVKEQTYGVDSRPTLWQRFIANRLIFFLVIMIAEAIYAWLPLYMFPILAYFSWMCMIKPTNYLLAQLTSWNGLGVGSLDLGWDTVTWYLGSPLVIPRWAMINLAIGFALVTWVFTPIVYFTNVWDTRNSPIGTLTSSTTDWSAMGIVTTATAFACLSAVLVHMLLHHGKEWWEQIRNRSLDQKGNDVHCRLMAIYPDVPDWWFGIVSLFALIVIIIVAQVSHMLAWYNVFFALLLPLIFVLPFGMVLSITGQTIQNPSLYYLFVLIVGALWVDNKSNMLTFIAIGYSTYCQALQLVSDMKLGLYMKIPPRVLFFVQMLGCLVCVSVSIGMQYYFYAVKRYYEQDGYTEYKSLFDRANVGSAIYDQKNFLDSSTPRNRQLLWSLLIGAVLPVPFWLASLRWRWCRLIHIPLILNFVSWTPLQAAGTTFTWLLIGIFAVLFFNKLCWKRHVFLTSSALDAGLFITYNIYWGPLVAYNVQFPSWWGFGGDSGDWCPLAYVNANETGS